ncbi:MAG: FAD-dependent oxidoreductase [Desulfobacterales bacterium]|nr:FAD-dependent oxidoreductase [Desulfobacterales bacterium]
MTVIKRGKVVEQFEFKTWRDLTPMNVSVGTMLHNMTGTWRFIKPVYEDKVPACQNACPAGNDIEGWIRLLQQEKYEQAYWHLKREQPFPAILGRICFKFCESACNRAGFDGCISVNELERFIGDQVAPSAPHPHLPEYNGKTIAVVGSGPAGMSAAYFGRLLGFRVVIFEALPEMGGLLCMGIPAYRLPKDIVAAEFEGLKNMGIDLKPGVTVGKDIKLESLCNDYDYVFLGTGVHKSIKIGVTGEEDCPHVFSGLDFLKQAALGEKPDIGKKVAVIGGGNTAIDAARTALRMGADVTVIYRRTQNEMPAHPEELQEAAEEGVKFRYLAAPEKIETDDNKAIKKLVCCEMELGEPDESGRRRPFRMEGNLFEVEADTILTAIGEAPVFEYLEKIAKTQKWVVQANEYLQVESLENTRAKIFAGGDITDIQHTVIHGVSTGKRAAIAMDCDRQGTSVSEAFEKITIGTGPGLSFSKYMEWKNLNPGTQDLKKVVDSEKIVYDYFEKAPPVEKSVQKPELRKTSFEPYRNTFAGEEAQKESARCIHCGRCTECDNCLLFCPDISVLLKEKEQFGYIFDYDYCKGCGICFSECPRHAITMISEETPVKKEVTE